MSINNLGTIRQCVLIAECLQTDYSSASPFSRMGKITMINHTISWLLDHGVNQIFLFYSKNKEICDQQIKKTWAKCSELKINPMYMKSQQMRNFGDVMRQVQFRNIISSDFIIMFADNFCNFNLHNTIRHHFKAKVELKNVILTSVMQKQTSCNKIHVLNAQTNQLLQMQKEKQSFKINQERIKLKKMNVQFRRDLSHKDIYLCSVEILKSFKETFQYTGMYDFINGMLTSEVYDEKIVGYILDGSQLSYRTNFSRDYFSSFIHYISRHFYPYTPDNPKCRFQTANNSKPTTKSFNKIIHSTSQISKQAKISNNCYIGQNVIIGASVIQKCIIEKNCQIGNGVKLKNCIILQGTKLQADHNDCLIETINESKQITYFSSKIGSRNIENMLREASIFEETPENEEQQAIFEQELLNLIHEDPQIQIITQLISVRKNYNKSLKEFTKQIIRMKEPQGVKGVESFVEKWGEILLKLNETQPVFIESLFFACQQIPKYNKAFHIFLQFLYASKVLDGFFIIQWFEAQISSKSDSVTLSKCEPFIQQLKSQSDSQQQEQSNQNSQNSQDA